MKHRSLGEELRGASDVIHRTSNRQLVFYGSIVMLIGLGIGKCSQETGAATTEQYDHLLVRNTAGMTVLAGLVTSCVEPTGGPAEITVQADLIVTNGARELPQGRVEEITFATGDQDCDIAVGAVYESGMVAEYLVASAVANGELGASAHGTYEQGKDFLADVQRFIEDGAQSI